MSRRRTGGVLEDRRGKTVRYAIRYRPGDGTRRYETTGATTPAEAEAILAARLAVSGSSAVSNDMGMAQIP